MTNGTHDDDEPTRWTSIGWQALLITNRLRCQAQLLEEQEPNRKSKSKESERTGERSHGEAQRSEVPVQNKRRGSI